MDFFTRIDGFALTPGNKTAGFSLAVSVPALQVLSTLDVSEEKWQALVDDARARVRNSGLLSEKDAADCGFERLNRSAVPRHFWVNRMFAASIGAEPRDLEELLSSDLVQYLGPELSYTPHNVDAPQHALVLMILAQAWTEWAHMMLTLAKSTNLKERKDHES